MVVKVELFMRGCQCGIRGDALIPGRWCMHFPYGGIVIPAHHEPKYDPGLFGFQQVIPCR